MTEEQRAKAIEALMLVCPALGAAAGICHEANHPLARIIAAELEELHQKAAAIFDDISHLPEVGLRTEEDGTVTMFIVHPPAQLDAVGQEG